MQAPDPQFPAPPDVREGAVSAHSLRAGTSSAPLARLRGAWARCVALLPLHAVLVSDSHLGSGLTLLWSHSHGSEPPSVFICKMPGISGSASPRIGPPCPGPACPP